MAASERTTNGELDLPDFTTESYWDERFKEEETYDWLLKYHQFSHFVEKHVNRNERILMLGCGNSKLSLEMYEDGYHNIVNVDFSSVCIEKMKEKHQHCPIMQWMVMDIKDLKFPDCSFDVVLEKGTLDALVANERDPWNMTDEGYDVMEQSLTQVSRVLKPGGYFLSITFSQPHFRRPLLARTLLKWNVELMTLGDHFHFFSFAMEKGKEMSAKDKELEKESMLKRQSNAQGNVKRQYVYVKDEESEQTFLNAFHL
ncbi:EEF1A lysine methyltransferase 4-like [Strongylocentrotus purpuratus]|uniref:EEF1A lysine methyltransferase 4 n=1 Tax=Strongylocentrotus purpuratus TaxID=7668 RepID=A0A7M7N840_STRPU|nr:EEF1A lysine methyltransferase 4-like [Strongylocentrotus purpuratus]|eukprot:XP_786072.2 PREDICTED: endothelin-converting enzyme 2 [Strongylocentrotus purpuratus]